MKRYKVKIDNKYLKFRQKHPTLHKINAFASAFLPFCLVVLITLVSGSDDVRAGFGFYALVGSFVLGIGLVMCVFCDYDKGAFWHACIYPIAIGAVIMVKNVLFVYKKDLGFELSETLLMFQIICYLSAFIILLEYYLAKDAISDYIAKKTGLSLSRVEDMTEGFFNGLWYIEIRKNHKIGWIFYFNAVFTAVALLFVVGAVFVLYFKHLAAAVLMLGLATAFFAIVLAVFAFAVSRKTKKKYFHNKKRGLFGKIPFLYELAPIALILYFSKLLIDKFMVLN